MADALLHGEKLLPQALILLNAYLKLVLEREDRLFCFLLVGFELFPRS